MQRLVQVVEANQSQENSRLRQDHLEAVQDSVGL